MIENFKQEQECCPRFEPSIWEDKIFDWEKKRFIKDKVATFFYMPLNFGAVITRLVGKIKKAGAEMPDALCLSDHPSKWKMDLMVAVDREIPGVENLTLSGKFMSKVYEGDFKNTKLWCADFERKAKEEGLEIKKWYMWYTTCPKCAKKYGKNYVAIIAEVE